MVVLLVRFVVSVVMMVDCGMLSSVVLCWFMISSVCGVVVMLELFMLMMLGVCLNICFMLVVMVCWLLVLGL